MKNILKFSALSLLVMIFFSSCEIEDPLAENTPAFSIVFNDNIETVAGSFNANGNTRVKLGFDASISQVVVTSRYTVPGVAGTKTHVVGTYQVNANSFQFEALSRALRAPADPVIVGGQFVDLLIDATSGANTYRRIFRANIVNPVTLAATAGTINPPSSFNDSTFTLRVNLRNDTDARIATVNIYERIGIQAGTTENATPILTRSYSSPTEATVTDNFEITIPSEAMVSFAGPQPNRTIRYRIEMISVNGQISSLTRDIVNQPVAAPVINTSLVLSNPNATGANRVSMLSLLTNRTNPASADSVDVMLTVTGAEGDIFNIGRGAGNTSQFVRLPRTFDYANANFQTIRNAYDAATPTSEISNLVVGDIFIVRVGARGDTHRSRYRLFRVNSAVIERTSDNDSMTFEYRGS
ncbi:MAG: hypothetical protein JJU28_13510 [Cyclobacteriaceae bacterium]|nr:hypothetical protein [Cyclobacteriaceae bacterium]